jgi:hypothetical protein
MTMIDGIQCKSQQAVPIEMRRLFYQIGLMGYGAGLAYEAEDLFQKLRIADPTAAYPLLALAHMATLSKDILKAEQLLLELELGPHGVDPVVCDWIQDVRKLAIAYSNAADFKS